MKSSKTSVVRHFLIATLAVATSQCALFGPSESEVYNLVRIHGHPLPATVTSATALDGTLYEFQVVRGRLELLEGRRVRKERDARDVLNGVPSDSILSGRYLGFFERTDTTLVIQVRDSRGALFDYTYQILDNGRLLRGREGFEQRVYEYVRE